MVIRALVYVLEGFCYWRFGGLIPVGFAVDKGRKRAHLRKVYLVDFQREKVKRKVQMGIAQFKKRLYLCSAFEKVVFSFKAMCFCAKGHGAVSE